jgi:hypothetical protein
LVKGELDVKMYGNVKCPNCGKDVRPLKVLGNDSFIVKECRCETCFHEFKVIKQ